MALCVQYQMPHSKLLRWDQSDRDKAIAYQRWMSEDTTDSEKPEEWISVGQAWHAYQRWCADGRENPGTKHKFGQALGREGHPSRVVRVGTRRWMTTSRVVRSLRIPSG